MNEKNVTLSLPNVYGIVLMTNKGPGMIWDIFCPSYSFKFSKVCF